MRRRLGGTHTAHILLESFDFAELTVPQESGDWETLEAMLGAAALRLERAGADFWLMACNTVHRVSDRSRPGSTFPFCTSPTQRGER